MRGIMHGWKLLQGLDPAETEIVKTSLTVGNPAYYSARSAGRSTRNISDVICFWRDDPYGLCVPRWAKLPLDIPTTDSSTSPAVQMPPSCFQALVGQQEAVDAALAVLARPGAQGACVLAPTGSGKTFIGTEVAVQLGLRTLILVHADFLAEHFTKTVQTVLPDEVVGFIGGGAFSLGVRFTVAMVQTLLARKMSQQFYDSFGLVICDEVHRHGALKWQEAVCQFPAAKRLGLTASRKRGDGLSRVFLEHVGPIVHTVTESQTLDSKVGEVRLPTSYRWWHTTNWQCDVCKSRITADDGNALCNCPAGACRPGTNSAKLLTILALDETRNRQILPYLQRAMAAGRQIIAFSDRRAQLEWFLQELDSPNVGIYAGSGTTKAKRAALAEARTKQVLLTTYKKTAESFDEPRLDTAVFLTPKANVLQPAGRTLRPFPDKPAPFLLDFSDPEIPLLAGWRSSRQRFYKKQGWLPKET